ncbi:hypothetical protein V6N11_053891 [Hibiscus sabdariffa]|uniref:Uncharacterized protein n=1 Tax=Hibiscus sabdariffa TaxID=183260 RepID=A0ABR2S2K6_9ROSI
MKDPVASYCVFCLLQSSVRDVGQRQLDLKHGTVAWTDCKLEDYLQHVGVALNQGQPIIVSVSLDMYKPHTVQFLLPDYA